MHVCMHKLKVTIIDASSLFQQFLQGILTSATDQYGENKMCLFYTHIHVASICSKQLLQHTYTSTPLISSVDIAPINLKQRSWLQVMGLPYLSLSGDLQ